MNRPTRRLLGPPRLARWLLLSLLLVEASVASAETGPGAEPVILLQPTNASSAVVRSLARIRDELSADRFHVIVAESRAAAGADVGPIIEYAGDAEAGATVVVLFGDPATGQAELCVVRRAAGRVAVRRATVVADPERISEPLATRALELLRATALELSIEIEHRPRAQPSPTPRDEAEVRPNVIPPEPPPAPIGVTADMGLGVWNSIEGPPLAVAPVARVGLRLSEWAWARLSVAGLGSRPRVDSAYGSAVLSQTVGLLEAAAVLRRDKRIRPMFSLGAGVLNVTVVGTGVAPYESREPQQWSAAFDGGVGVAIAVGSRAALVTELHALVAAPHPVVRFADVRAATIGYPALILTLALQVAP